MIVEVAGFFFSFFLLPKWEERIDKLDLQFVQFLFTNPKRPAFCRVDFCFVI